MPVLLEPSRRQSTLIRTILLGVTTMTASAAATASITKRAAMEVPTTTALAVPTANTTRAEKR